MREYEFGVVEGGQKHTEIVSIHDDTSPEEIERLFSEWLANYVDSWCVPVTEETGMFFCQNCGHTPLTNVTYGQKPETACEKCGFTDWIFEPTGEDGDE